MITPPLSIWAMPACATGAKSALVRQGASSSSAAAAAAPRQAARASAASSGERTLTAKVPVAMVAGNEGMDESDALLMSETTASAMTSERGAETFHFSLSSVSLRPSQKTPRNSSKTEHERTPDALGPPLFPTPRRAALAEGGLSRPDRLARLQLRARRARGGARSAAAVIHRGRALEEQATRRRRGCVRERASETRAAAHGSGSPILVGASGRGAGGAPRAP